LAGTPSILQDAHGGDRDQTARHQLVEFRQEGRDLFLAVDDFHHERKIFGQAEDLRRVQPAGMAEAEGSAQDGCTRHMHLARLEHDGFVERPAAVPIVFTDEDAQSPRVPWHIHGDAVSFF
jgi:hypothetical protein